MDTVSFQVSPEIAFRIEQVLERLAKIRWSNGDAFTADDRQHHRMNLMACEANGCPMDWLKLRKADDFNFLHDVYGIDRHLCRQTGKLLNHFLPRCHAQAPEAETV